VYLERRNRIAQAVSISVGAQTGEWTSLHPRADVAPSYDAARIIDALAMVRQAQAEANQYFRRYGGPVAVLEFEDLLADRDIVRLAFERITQTPLSRVGAPSLALKSQASPSKKLWEDRFRSETLPFLKQTLPPDHALVSLVDDEIQGQARQ